MTGAASLGAAATEPGAVRPSVRECGAGSSGAVSTGQVVSVDLCQPAPHSVQFVGLHRELAAGGEHGAGGTHGLGLIFFATPLLLEFILRAVEEVLMPDAGRLITTRPKSRRSARECGI